MKCKSCDNQSVTPPAILCSACEAKIGGNAFLFCVKCRHTWGAVNKEERFAHFEIIPGMTYTTTGCSSCSGDVGNVRIVEEQQSRKQVNFSTDWLPAFTSMYQTSESHQWLKSALARKANDMQDSGLWSLRAHTVVCRALAAAHLGRQVLGHGSVILVVIPGNIRRGPSIDIIRLEE